MTLLKRFQAWRYRRHLVRVAKWERTRTRGKARFVIRVALIWGACMILFTSLSDYYFRGIRIFQLLYFVAAGPVVGLVSWWINEGEYKAAQIDARMRETREQVSTED